MGRLSYFIRLAGCNLMCGGKGTEKDGKLHNGATWRCDSIEVWMKGQAIEFPALVEAMGGYQFINNLRAGHHLIFTGGEPLLQKDSILEFIQWLKNTYELWNPDCNLLCEIETNGTIHPGRLLNHIIYFNVSPKLSNSGEPADKRINKEVIMRISQQPWAMFKFVISSATDLLEIENDYLPLIDNRSKIWLMPAADNRQELDRLSEYVVNACKRQGYNYSHRLHISIWDKKTGV